MKKVLFITMALAMALAASACTAGKTQTTITKAPVITVNPQTSKAPVQSAAPQTSAEPQTSAAPQTTDAWEENDLTDGVPEPEFTLDQNDGDGTESFTVSHTAADVTRAEITQYGKDLQSAGFTVDTSDTTGKIILTATIDGKTVTVTWTSSDNAAGSVKIAIEAE